MACSCAFEDRRWARELRSSATLAWREESGRAVRAEAKAEVVMGIAVEGDVGVEEEMALLSLVSSLDILDLFEYFLIFRFRFLFCLLCSSLRMEM